MWSAKCDALVEWQRMTLTEAIAATHPPGRSTEYHGGRMNTDFLLVLARRIAPGVACLDDEGKERVIAAIARAVASRPRAVRRQLSLFLNVIRWAPVARYGRPLDRLAPAQQDAVLRWFMDAPVALLRQGFWGLKTLVYMGYYGLPEVADRIGYRPSRSGNAQLTGTR